MYLPINAEAAYMTPPETKKKRPVECSMTTIAAVFAMVVKLAMKIIKKKDHTQGKTSALMGYQASDSLKGQ